MLATNNLCNLELFVKLTDNRSIIYKKGLYGCSQRNKICEYLRANLRTNLRIVPHASIAKHFHIKYLADISLVRNLKNLITKTVFYEQSQFSTKRNRLRSSTNLFLSTHYAELTDIILIYLLSNIYYLITII